MTTTDFFIYTSKTTVDNTPVTSTEAGAVTKREDWSNQAKFEAGEYQTISSILKHLYKPTETKKPLNPADYVEDRSLIDFLVIQGVPNTYRGCYYIGTNYKAVI